MVYYAVFTALLSFVLCGVATALDGLTRQKKSNFAFQRGKLVTMPLGVAVAGLLVTGYAVLYGLPNETAPFCAETVGAILVGAGALLGLLISLLLMMVCRKNRCRTENILSVFRAVGLYGASIFFVLVLVFVDGLLV